MKYKLKDKLNVKRTWVSDKELKELSKDGFICRAVSYNSKRDYVKTLIMEYLNKVPSATFRNIRKEVPYVNKPIMKELESDGKIKIIHHYLKNSNKTFIHKETKKVNKIKGTMIIEYKAIKNN